MTSPQAGTYLCFDFGLKRIGVAVGQTLTKTANPLITLQAEEGLISEAQVQQLIKTWQPQGIVVGLPLNMDGTEQAITQKAQVFADFLQQKCSLPIYFMDERLTSVEAREQVYAQGGYQALQKAKIDSVAAKLILESWFSEHF